MEKIKHFISTFMTAVSNCTLYSRDHEAFDDLAKKTHSVLLDVMKDRLELMILENELVVNSTPYRCNGLHKNSIIKRFKKKGIARVDFIQGISLPEVKQFIIDMSSPEKALKVYPHIKFGTVDINVAVSDMDGVLDQHSIPENIEKVKDIFHLASPFKMLNIAGIDEVVAHFIASIKKEANILKYLNPVKMFSEYTYTHATNVAMISVFQAESLGIDSDLLRDIGVAALLHDTGKMYISNEILEKKDRLDEKEFAEIKKHPLYGARYLAKIDDVPRLASIVAFEHHIKYDQSGYPAIRVNGRTQHICSQIIAIADFFDALRSQRPYRESMNIKNILALMKKGSGKDFNPVLVDNFIGKIEQMFIN